MRLIATFQDIEQGRNFSNFLHKQDVANNCEIVPNGKEAKCRIWVFEEDQVGTAWDWYQLFVLHPRHQQFQSSPPPPLPTKEKTVKTEASFAKEPLGTLNFLLLFLCGILFLISQFTTPFQETGGLSPIKKALLYDYPSYWQGLYHQVVENLLHKTPLTPFPPLFEKIREGEVWRLFTPALLHADIFHLVFNMIWLIVIGKQMEKRLGMARYCLFILIAGIFSNTAQYLISGPNFIGFSGILCAMILFVYVRQRKSPWEGYFLQPATFAFFIFFVFLMFAIQLVSFISEISLDKAFSSNVANTAHLAGALIGYLLGRLNYFSAGYR